MVFTQGKATNGMLKPFTVCTLVFLVAFASQATVSAAAAILHGGEFVLFLLVLELKLSTI